MPYSDNHVTLKRSEKEIHMSTPRIFANVLGVIAFAGLICALLADSQDNVWIRVTGIVVLGVCGISSMMMFDKASHS